MGTLKKRYFYKIGAGFFSVASLGVIQALALRGLGPASYGIFDFLNTFYIQVITFLDMGLSDCVYTKLSKRPHEEGLVASYALFVLTACTAIAAFTLGAVVTPLASSLWPGIPERFVIMGASLGIFTWISSALNKTVDAYGLTVEAEIGRVIQKVMGMMMLGLLVWTGTLTLESFFCYWIFLMAFLGAAFVWVNRRGGHPFPRSLSLAPMERSAYAAEFYAYSHPLFVHAAVTFATGFLGRWLLQRFSGSVEQAMFGLAEQMSSMCALSVRVMAPLLLREFSIAHHSGDRAGMADVFRRRIPVLQSVTIYFSCFTAFHSATVVRLLGGEAYAAGQAAAAIMSIAAIPMTGALMYGTILLANGRTDLYRNVGITVMLFGAALNLGLLAPASSGGLHLGSVGLAAQALGVNIIAAGVLLILAVRSLELSFLPYVGRQAVSFAILFAAAGGSRWISILLNEAGLPMLPAFLAAGLLYTGAVALLVRAVPRVFGLEDGIDIITKLR